MTGITEDGQSRIVTIAVIDEYPLMLSGITMALDDMEGFEVIAQGSSPAEALEIAQSQSPELMIIDLSSSTNGLAMMEEISSACPGIKFIVLSEDEIEGAAAEAVPFAHTYVSKGLTRSQLEATVRSFAEP